jgi:hypothetical protein
MILVKVTFLILPLNVMESISHEEHIIIKSNMEMSSKGQKPEGRER